VAPPPQLPFLAQRFARHMSPLTTTIYTHPCDEEYSAGFAVCPAEITYSHPTNGGEDFIVGCHSGLI